MKKTVKYFIIAWIVFAVLIYIGALINNHLNADFIEENRADLPLFLQATVGIAEFQLLWTALMLGISLVVAFLVSL